LNRIDLTESIQSGSADVVRHNPFSANNLPDHTGQGLSITAFLLAIDCLPLSKNRVSPCPQNSFHFPILPIPANNGNIRIRSNACPKTVSFPIPGY
jgi:hypothetical protein